MRKPSCLISCSHWPPECSLSVLVGRHGAMNPAGKVRWNMRKQIELGRDDCNSAELVASATLVSSSAPNTLPVLGLTMWTCLQAKQTTPSYVSPPSSDPLSANQPRRGVSPCLNLVRFGDFVFEVTQIGMH